MISQVYSYAVEHMDELIAALGEHLGMTAAVLLISASVSIPLGIWAARSKTAAAGLINAANTLRVIPSLAVLFLVIPYLGITFAAAVFALTLLALPPILVNTYAGFTSLDPFMLETAAGIGMTGWQVFTRVELPLAMPVILAGVRTAVVEVIASATLAAFIGAGGLGIFITRGLALYDTRILLVGAVPIAALTLAAEAGIGTIESRFRQYP